MIEQKEIAEIECVIAKAIDRRDDPEALALKIMAELGRAGLCIVPREPTGEMLAAVAMSRDAGHYGLCADWRAMLDAAPTRH